MRLYYLLTIFILSSCSGIELWFDDTINIIQPIPIANQKGFSGDSTDEEFLISTFEYDDITNRLWWDGNIGSWQAGILSGRYTLYLSEVDIGVYSYIDKPAPIEDYEIKFNASAGFNAHKSNQYGIVFDYQDSASYGLFFIDGYGQYAIGYFDNVEWHLLAKGEIDDVNLLSREFSLALIINDNEIQPLFNNTKIQPIYYPQKINGHSGVYLGSRVSENAGLSIYEFSISPMN